MADEAAPAPDRSAPDHSAAIDLEALDRPLVVWDGDCGFCRRSVLRLESESGDRLRYAPYQSVVERIEASERFDLEATDFQQAVHLIYPDGRVVRGAPAIFEALDHGRRDSPWSWIYAHLPGFDAVADWGYQWVADHRPFVSTASRRIIGEDLRRPTWQIARWLFLRLVALLALVAFYSFFAQAHALIGQGGILPVAELLGLVDDRLIATGELTAVGAFLELPTALWWSASDAAISALCIGGMVASAALFVGLWPRGSLVVIWASYLSLVVGGQVFMGYQWDALLLETAFVALFVAPRGLLPGWLRGGRRPQAVSRLGVFLVLWLTFRLMFMSGVVKLTAGDPTWHDLTAMSYHWWTQPLPQATSWWVHQLPMWVDKLATLGTFVVEIGLPLLLLGPRRLRRLAAWATLGLQVVIVLTGNYGFFNWLTIALAVFALDDAVWHRLLPGWFTRRFRRDYGALAAEPDATGWRRRALVGVVALVVVFTSVRAVEEFSGRQLWPDAVHAAVGPWRTLNNYGLFRVMTTERPEIVVEASLDGERWQAYDFAFKPDDPAQSPRTATPHQPRLDWQMWFAALGDCQRNRWFIAFQRRLLEADPAVLRLLAAAPFDAQPPRYVRSTVYDYRFTTATERAETGQWWVRERRGSYCPTLALEDGQLVGVRAETRR